jgi:ABC-type nitrate/sulfonate/bicarbonate transport system ATPase subunit
MKKRLAFARLQAMQKRIWLLDEPFSSLDVYNRVNMWKMLKRLVEENDLAAVVITHDLEEALFLSHHIVVCKGPPLQVVDILSTTGENCRQRLMQLVGLK